MNKFKLVVIAIVLAACGTKEGGDTIETPKTFVKDPALALRDSAMQMVYGPKGEEIDYEKSLELLDKAMALDPGSKFIFNSKMQVLSKSGSEDGVFNMMVSMDTMDFKDLNADLQLGIAYELRGEMDKADAKYHEAINMYAAILDTMQNTQFLSRNNNVLHLAVAERLVQESQDKLQLAMTDDEKQYLADNISLIENAKREDLLEMHRKKMK